MSDEEDFVYDDDSSEDEDEGMDTDDDGIQFSGGEDDVSPTARQGRPQTCFQTLTPDMISAKMFEIIKEVNAVFQVS